VIGAACKAACATALVHYALVRNRGRRESIKRTERSASLAERALFMRFASAQKDYRHITRVAATNDRSAVSAIAVQRRRRSNTTISDDDACRKYLCGCYGPLG
jgi:hypothetical protein